MSPCVLTLRSVIKDTNQRETPEASPTPLLISSHNLHSPRPLYYSHSTLGLSFPPLCLSPPPPFHNTSLRFRLTHFASPCFFSSLPPSLSLPPSAAVSRPRHPTLPSAADINQPLCGKQREGRREREGCKKKGRKPQGSQ